MVQDIVDPLAAKSLLAEMLCQNGCGHLFEISHFINGDSAADNLFQIRSTDILRLPDLFATIFFLIFLIHGCNDLLCPLQKDHKFLKSLTLL